MNIYKKNNNLIIVLTESQLEFIESKRKFLGSGEQHRVLTLHNIHDKEFENQDVVLKIGLPEDVQPQINFFKEFPDYSPIVFKSGIIKVSDKSIEKNDLYPYVDYENNMAYAYVERLDTKEFLRRYNSMYNKLDYRNRLDFIKFSDNPINEQYLKYRIKDYLIKNGATPEDLSFYDEFVKLMIDIWKNYYAHDEKLLDFHSENFGIDKKGKIKCLDI